MLTFFTYLFFTVLYKKKACYFLYTYLLFSICEPGSICIIIVTACCLRFMYFAYESNYFTFTILDGCCIISLNEKTFPLDMVFCETALFYYVCSFSNLLVLILWEIMHAYRNEYAFPVVGIFNMIKRILFP